MPVGTVITDIESGDVLADLTHHRQRALIAKGGKGGIGNLHFKSSTNRTPRQFTRGDPGESRTLKLELKVLADVGLLGMPNAGKSTLIRAVSAAKPKVADYPFTTLHPSLGVVRVDHNRSFVIADVPGLIEGAHRGHGLGHQFLRHLERTKVLLHVVDVSGASGRDPVQDLETVREELRLFQPALAAKPQLVAANKMDAVTDDTEVQALKKRALALDLPFFQVSAASGAGLPEVLEAIWRVLAAERAAAPVVRVVPVVMNRRDAGHDAPDDEPDWAGPLDHP